MKKKFLLIPLMAVGAYFTLSSNSTGYLSNATGSDGGTVGCGGGGCHSSGPSSAILSPTIVVDSAGTVVTHYVPGVTYRVTLVAGSLPTSGLTKFGFQLSSVKSSAVAQAGTFSSLPAEATITTMGAASLKVVRHNTPKADSVTSFALLYPVSVNWTAPVAGTDSVKFYGVINAVDNNGGASSADLWNKATTTISELVDHTGVGSVAAGVALTAFPNPVASALTLQMNNTTAGTYGVSVYDMSGRVVATQSVVLSGTTGSATINMSNCAAGVYNVVVEKDGVRSAIAVAKQ